MAFEIDPGWSHPPEGRVVEGYTSLRGITDKSVFVREDFGQPLYRLRFDRALGDANTLTIQLYLKGKLVARVKGNLQYPIPEELKGPSYRPEAMREEFEQLLEALQEAARYSRD
jgi:hypothetical protein